MFANFLGALSFLRNYLILSGRRKYFYRWGCSIVSEINILRENLIKLLGFRLNLMIHFTFQFNQPNKKLVVVEDRIRRHFERFTKKSVKNRSTRTWERAKECVKLIIRSSTSHPITIPFNSLFLALVSERGHVIYTHKRCRSRRDVNVITETSRECLEPISGPQHVIKMISRDVIENEATSRRLYPSEKRFEQSNWWSEYHFCRELNWF